MPNARRLGFPEAIRMLIHSRLFRGLRVVVGAWKLAARAKTARAAAGRLCHETPRSDHASFQRGDCVAPCRPRSAIEDADNWCAAGWELGTVLESIPGRVARLRVCRWPEH